jgi:hypothetical protein
VHRVEASAALFRRDFSAATTKNIATLGWACLRQPWSNYNQTALILERRQTVLDAAYRVHPGRFVRQAPKPAAVPTEVWINKPLKSNEMTH